MFLLSSPLHLVVLDGLQLPPPSLLSLTQKLADTNKINFKMVYESVL